MATVDPIANSNLVHPGTEMEMPRLHVEARSPQAQAAVSSAFSAPFPLADP
jgi:hypothetical protein